MNVVWRCMCESLCGNKVSFPPYTEASTQPNSSFFFRSFMQQAAAFGWGNFNVEFKSLTFCIEGIEGIFSSSSLFQKAAKKYQRDVEFEMRERNIEEIEEMHGKLFSNL